MSRYYFIEKSFHWQKGVVIASTVDANQNHLTTGTLQMENVENKAAYDVLPITTMIQRESVTSILMKWA